MTAPAHPFFGEIIHAYSRADAIRDGALVDVTETAREAGFTYPVAMTRAAYEDLVAWTDADDKRKRAFTGQSDAGRLWDVLWMGRNAAQRAARGTDRVTFGLLRVPRDGRGTMPRKAFPVLHVGPGDDGAPVITIMERGES